MPQPPLRSENAPDEPPPPMFGTWRRIYIAVACYLAVIILLFDIFTRVLNK